MTHATNERTHVSSERITPNRVVNLLRHIYHQETDRIEPGLATVDVGDTLLIVTKNPTDKASATSFDASWERADGTIMAVAAHEDLMDPCADDLQIHCGDDVWGVNPNGPTPDWATQVVDTFEGFAQQLLPT
jgi:hypothetical protein